MLYHIVVLCSDLSTSHCVSMLETIRTAGLCLKLAASCHETTNNHKKSSYSRRSVDVVEVNGHCSEKIELTDVDWKDNKETCSDEDDDDVDDDDVEDVVHSGPDAGTLLSYKDLFRMATLGGATGKYHSCMSVSHNVA